MPPAKPVNTQRLERILAGPLRREQKCNAVNRALAVALNAALNLLDDPELLVGVLTGGKQIAALGGMNGLLAAAEPMAGRPRPVR
jgi:enoyl-CoA hydratase/carnithine racemase